MNPQYQIITLADGVTKAIQLAGPTFTVSDLQDQIIPLAAQLNTLNDDIASLQQRIAADQETAATLTAQIQTINDQITSLNAPDVVATPTTMTTTDPAQPV
jgi:hypothetical protein